MNIIGDPTAVQSTVQHIITEGPTYSIYINNKSVILLGQSDASNSATNSKKYQNILQFSDEDTSKRILHHPSFTSHPSNYDPSTYGGVILGCPIGDISYISNWVEEKISKIEEEIINVKTFPDSQSQWIFFNYNIINKFLYLFRCIPYHLMKDHTDRIDSGFRDLFSTIIGRSFTNNSTS